MVIAVDFDGTIVEHKYPEIGKLKPFAVETLNDLAAEGNKIILFTSRSGKLLDDAVEFCKSKGIEFYAVNSNYPDGALFTGREEKSPKVIADVYIDDRNLGGLPDWGTIYEMITAKRAAHHKKKKKSFFKRLFGGKHKHHR